MANGNFLADLLLQSGNPQGFAPSAPMPAMANPAGMADPNSRLLASMLLQETRRRSEIPQQFATSGNRGRGTLLAGVMNSIAQSQALEKSDEKIADIYQQIANAQAAEQEAAIRAAEVKREQDIIDYMRKQAIEAQFREPKEPRAPTKPEMVQEVTAGLTPGSEEYIAAISTIDPGAGASLREEQREVAQAEVVQEKAAGEAQRALDTTRRLLGNQAGLRSAAGPIEGVLPSFRGVTIDFERDLENLGSLLTVGNLDRMTGVLSESDIKLLRDAASGNLDLRQSESRLYEVLAKAEAALSGSLGVESEYAGTTYQAPSVGERFREFWGISDQAQSLLDKYR